MNFKFLSNIIITLNFLFINSSNVFADQAINETKDNVNNVADASHKSICDTGDSFVDIVSLNVNSIPYEDFSSGCEIVSIVNLLNYYMRYYKYQVDLNNFYENYFVHMDWQLIKSKNKETQKIEEIIYGPHPDYAFPGDPRIVSGDNCGFGCFKYAICNSINKFFENFDKSKNKKYKNKDGKKHNKFKKFKAVFEEGVSTDDAISRFIKKGIPVLIWSTQPDDKDIPKEQVSKTVLKMRKSGGLGNWWIVNFPKFLQGTIYTWTRGEHCSLLIGESAKCYKICDPFRGIIYVDKESLNESRKIFNNQIVYLEEEIPKQIEKITEIVLKIKNKVIISQN